MSARLDQWSKQEVRAVIRFLNARNISAAEIHRQLVEVYGDDVMTRQSVAKWCVHFRAGRVIMEDSERRGRPTTANTADNRTLVENAIRGNSRITNDTNTTALKLCLPVTEQRNAMQCNVDCTCS